MFLVSISTVWLRFASRNTFMQPYNSAAINRAAMTEIETGPHLDDTVAVYDKNTNIFVYLSHFF